MFDRICNVADILFGLYRHLMLMGPCSALIVYNYANSMEVAQRGTKSTDDAFVYSDHKDERTRQAT